MKEKMKQEAIKRMRLLNLSSTVISDFKKNNKLYYSEDYGILYWISNKPDWQDYIKNFELENDVLVYHAELTKFVFGNCLSLLYVSNDEDEWERDLEDIKNGYIFCYTWNIDDAICSEFGSIGVKSLNGGIKRTA